MMLVIIVEEIKKDFNLSDGEFGFFMGFVYGLFFGIVGFLSGLVIDRCNCL